MTSKFWWEVDHWCKWERALVQEWYTPCGTQNSTGSRCDDSPEMDTQYCLEVRYVWNHSHMLLVIPILYKFIKSSLCDMESKAFCSQVIDNLLQCCSKKLWQFDLAWLPVVARLNGWGETHTDGRDGLSYKVLLSRKRVSLEPWKLNTKEKRVCIYWCAEFWSE